MEEKRLTVTNAIITGYKFGYNTDYHRLELTLMLHSSKGDVCFTTALSYPYDDAVENLECDKGNYMAYCITKVFEVVNVKDINEIKGKPIRVIFLGNLCYGIQHFLSSGIFFIPRLITDIKDEIDITSIFDSEYYCEIYNKNKELYNKTQNLTK